MLCLCCTLASNQQRFRLTLTTPPVLPFEKNWERQESNRGRSGQEARRLTTEPCRRSPTLCLLLVSTQKGWNVLISTCVRQKKSFVQLNTWLGRSLITSWIINDKEFIINYVVSLVQAATDKRLFVELERVQASGLWLEIRLSLTVWNWAILSLIKITMCQFSCAKSK